MIICETSFWVETFVGQLLALITFFGFPALQFVLLKRFSKREGRAELWYLPSYGFRLVIRNIPNTKVLSDLRSKTFLRKIIDGNVGSSVATFQDETLSERDEFYLFPGTDQILLSFKIEGDDRNNLTFVKTNKIGEAEKEVLFRDLTNIISDYSANIENYLNFDVKIQKRVVITSEELVQYWEQIRKNNREQSFVIKTFLDIS